MEFKKEEKRIKAYFFMLLLVIAYYDETVAIVNTFITVIGNFILGTIYKNEFLLVYSFHIWIYVLSEFIIAAILADGIYSLFCNIKKDKNLRICHVEGSPNKFVEGQKLTISVSREISKLSKNSNSIKNIIDVINNISEEMNLLALNSAIEAARSGELGKGFAVAADEARKLAEQSSVSIKKVDDILVEIINVIDKNKSAIKYTKNNIYESNEKLTLTINSIVYASDEIVKLINMLNIELKDIEKLRDNSIKYMENLSSDYEESMDSTKEVSDFVVNSKNKVQDIVNNLSQLLNENVAN